MINMIKYPIFLREKQCYDIQEKTDYIRILNLDVINVLVFTMLIANGNHMLVLRKKWFYFKLVPKISKLQ